MTTIEACIKHLGAKVVNVGPDDNFFQMTFILDDVQQETLYPSPQTSSLPVSLKPEQQHKRRYSRKSIRRDKTQATFGFANDVTPRKPTVNK